MEKQGSLSSVQRNLLSWGHRRLAQASRNSVLYSDPWLIFSALWSLQILTENHMLTCSLLLSRRDIDCRHLSGKHHGNTFALAFCALHVQNRSGRSSRNQHIHFKLTILPSTPFFEPEKIIDYEVKGLGEKNQGDSEFILFQPLILGYHWSKYCCRVSTGKKNLNQQNLKK